ncbi:MAG: class I SAM-dependent methyltransferase [Betaproteobacteria bacterium]|nr:class I SAM-dependent methyltransferase [Betaproteobacteria bacterium]
MHRVPQAVHLRICMWRIRFGIDRLILNRVSSDRISRDRIRLAAAFLFLFCAGGMAIAQDATEKDNVAGPYVPTPWVIVDEMLKLADITAADTVYDLGSGDGRLVITSAKRFGARGVGIELQEKLVELARVEARTEGVDARVRFKQADLFEESYFDASVVTLYLLPRFVTRLVPKLRAELKPSSRIVSHDYPLSPWPPDKVLSFEADEKEAITGSKRTTLYYYLVPASIAGRWVLTLPAAWFAEPLSVDMTQNLDGVEGKGSVGGDSFTVRDATVRGERVRFALLTRGRYLILTGSIANGRMQGEVVWAGQRETWSARLESVEPQSAQPRKP